MNDLENLIKVTNLKLEDIAHSLRIISGREEKDAGVDIMKPPMSYAEKYLTPSFDKEKKE